MSHIIDLIISLAAMIAAVFAYLESRANKDRLVNIHLAINGRLDELLKTSTKLARTEGIVEEKERVERNGKVNGTVINNT